MRRFFVIAIDPITKDQANAVQNWIGELGVGWWHWIDGIWLIVADDPNVSTTSLRDNLGTLAPGVNTIVLEVNPITWSGRGPNSDDRNMFTWLLSNWKQ